jgi:anti-sigma factor RsiW
MIGHLGARVSALLDGQLSPAEAEEAWAHVYACHACRDLVEREGWVKTRLAGLSCGSGTASQDLKGSLLSLTPGERFLAEARGSGGARRNLGVAVLGGGALGAAMVGVLALGFAPGSAPPVDRRPPASRVETAAASDDAAEDLDDSTRIAPAHVVPPVSTVAPLGGPAFAGTAALPDWVERLLP